MNFEQIPEILLDATLENEHPWTLKRMGILLKTAYEIIEHPLLKSFNDYEGVEAFNIELDNLEAYKRFNRTIIERTIQQANFFSQINSEHGIPTMASKGIEFSILCLKSFLETAKGVMKYEMQKLISEGAAIRIYRLHAMGDYSRCKIFHGSV